MFKKRKERLTIGFDVDDCICNLTDAVLNELSELGKKYEKSDVTWGFTNFQECDRQIAFNLFEDPYFMGNLKLLSKIKNTIDTLIRQGHDVLFLTSAYPGAMTARAKYLKKNFPEVPVSNIIITGRKDLVAVDILFDDNLDHVINSIANYPIIVDQPWNRGENGYIRIKPGDSEQIFTITEMVAKEYSYFDIQKEVKTKFWV